MRADFPLARLKAMNRSELREVIATHVMRCIGRIPDQSTRAVVLGIFRWKTMFWTVRMLRFSAIYLMRMKKENKHG